MSKILRKNILKLSIFFIICIFVVAFQEFNSDNGTAICTASYSQLDLQICSDGTGGAIITWTDYRVPSNVDVYAQKIFANGSVAWTTNGVAIGSEINTQAHPQICNDGTDGAIITWEDERNGLGNTDIYTQKVFTNGIYGD